MNIKKLNVLRFSTLIISVIFIAIGIMKGENSVVLQKAINICLQCIGIG